jgi:hypothetical protein
MMKRGCTPSSLSSSAAAAGSQVLADVMLSHWPSRLAAAVAEGLDPDRHRRPPRAAQRQRQLVTEIVYLNRQGKREPISIEQHAFKYHITIQYLGD